MSGAKRSSKYRKSVTNDYINSFPEPEADEAIVKVRGSRGANIFEIELLPSVAGAKVELALLPNRFKNLIWVKRNDYLIVKKGGGGEGGVHAGGAETADVDADAIAVALAATAVSSESTFAIQYEVQHVLNKDQIKHLRTVGKWPELADGSGMPPPQDYYCGLGGGEEGGGGGVEEEEEEVEEEEELEVDKKGNTVFATQPTLGSTPPGGET